MLRQVAALQQPSLRSALRSRCGFMVNPAVTTKTSRWLATRVPDPPTSHHPYTPLPNAKASIIYTETDEAPALATFALYPIVSKVRRKSDDN